MPFCLQRGSDIFECHRKDKLELARGIYVSFNVPDNNFDLLHQCAISSKDCEFIHYTYSAVLHMESVLNTVKGMMTLHALEFGPTYPSPTILIKVKTL